MSLATWMLKEFVAHKYFDIALSSITEIANQIARDNGYSAIVSIVQEAKKRVKTEMGLTQDSTLKQLTELAEKLKVDIESRYRDPVIQEIMLQKLSDAIGTATTNLKEVMQKTTDIALTEINRAADKAILSLPQASSTLPSIKATPEGGYFIDFSGD